MLFLVDSIISNGQNLSETNEWFYSSKINNGGRKSGYVPKEIRGHDLLKMLP